MCLNLIKPKKEYLILSIIPIKSQIILIDSRSLYKGRSNGRKSEN